jgi:hypothetical protein
MPMRTAYVTVERPFRAAVTSVAAIGVIFLIVAATSGTAPPPAAPSSPVEHQSPVAGGPIVTPTPFPSVYPTLPVWTGPLPTPDYSLAPPRSVAPPSAELLRDLAVPSKIEYSMRKLSERYWAGGISDADRQAYRIGPGDVLPILVITRPGETRQAKAAIAALGGTIRVGRDFHFEARVPLAVLGRLESIPSIQQVTMPTYGIDA